MEAVVTAAIDQNLYQYRFSSIKKKKTFENVAVFQFCMHGQNLIVIASTWS